MEIAQLQFQFLLNTATLFKPLADSYKQLLQNKPDTSSISNHPYLLQIQQQQDIANATIKVEQSKLMPEFLIGINNMSIKGTGADDKLYTAGHRFTSVQAGIAIPLFAKSQKARVQAAKYSSKLAESNYAIGKQNLQTAYETALRQYQKQQQTVAYIEQNTLPAASVITNTANRQFANGSINYLEWVMLINQAITTQNDHIEAVKNLNDAITELHFFNNK